MLLPPLAKCPKLFGRSNIDGVIHNRRRGHDAFIQFIAGQDFKLIPSLDHGDGSPVRSDIDPAVRRDGRGEIPPAGLSLSLETSFPVLRSRHARFPPLRIRYTRPCQTRGDGTSGTPLASFHNVCDAVTFWLPPVRTDITMAAFMRLSLNSRSPSRSSSHRARSSFSPLFIPANQARACLSVILPSPPEACRSV